MAEDVAALGSPDIWKSLEAGARIGAKVRRKRKGLRYVGDKE